jgi:hypothetical protein
VPLIESACLSISGSKVRTRASTGEIKTLSETASENQCRLVDTSVKVLVRLLPTTATEAMITSAISEAIRPYSIAVAPDSSRTNFFKDENILNPPALRAQVSASVDNVMFSPALALLSGIAKLADQNNC